jgi:hypothetical protein
LVMATREGSYNSTSRPILPPAGKLVESYMFQLKRHAPQSI